MSGESAFYWRRKIKVGRQGDCMISPGIKDPKLERGSGTFAYRNGCNAGA